jgi:hypothetical protein
VSDAACPTDIQSNQICEVLHCRGLKRAALLYVATYMPVVAFPTDTQSHQSDGLLRFAAMQAPQACSAAVCSYLQCQLLPALLTWHNQICVLLHCRGRKRAALLYVAAHSASCHLSH